MSTDREREALAAIILGRTATAAADRILAAGWMPRPEKDRKDG